MPNPPIYQVETTGPVNTANFNAFLQKIAWAQHGNGLDYNGKARKFFAVNSTESAIELVDVDFTGSAIPVSGTSIALSRNQRAEQPGTGGVKTSFISVASAGTSAVTITLPNDLNAGERFLIVIPDAQTGNVTIGPQAGASFVETGVSSYTVSGPFGNGEPRWIEAFCVANSTGTAAVYQVFGDIVPPSSEIYLGDVRVYAGLSPTVDGHLVNFGYLKTYARPLRLATSTKTGSYTLADSDAGSILYFNITSNATLTIPTSLSAGAMIPVFNIGTATLTVQKSGGGSISLAAGEYATIVIGPSGAVRVAKGSFTAL